MIIFDVQRFSVHDGPGIRTTVFLKGCPLRCLWCQNPEGLEFGLADPGRSGKVREVTPRDLAEELRADEVFFETSGGGVTFSGGEPLSQVDELIETARILRARGIHVAVETALGVPAAVGQLVGEVDLVLADLKTWKPEDHLAWTGYPVGPLLTGLGQLAAAAQGGQVELVVRTPMVPGFTATEANVEGIRRILAPWAPTVRWELLDFNPLARSKYEALGRTDYTLAHLSSGLGAPALEHLRAVAGLAPSLPKETP